MWVMKPSWITHGQKQRLPILSVDIDPSGERLATGCLDNTIGLWKVICLQQDNQQEDKEPQLAILSNHSAQVNCVRWSPTGQYLASGSSDSCIILWTIGISGLSDNLQQWRASNTFRGHSSDIQELAWNNSGKLLASGSIDNTIIVWDIQSKVIKKILTGHGSYVSGLGFHPMGNLLFSLGEDHKLIKWSTQSWKPLQQKQLQLGHKSNHVLKKISFSTDGLYLVTPGPQIGPFQYLASQYQSTSLDLQKYFSGHLQPVSVIRASPVMYSSSSGPVSVIAIGGYDSTVSIWKIGDQHPVAIRDIFNSAVADICWSPTGKLLVASSNQGTVFVVYIGNSLGEPINQSKFDEYMRNVYGDIPQQPIRINIASTRGKQLVKIAPQPLTQQIQVRLSSGKRRIQPILLSGAVQVQIATPQQNKQNMPLIINSLQAPPIPQIDDSFFNLNKTPTLSLVVSQSKQKNYNSNLQPTKFLQVSQFMEPEGDLILESFELNYSRYKTVIRLRQRQKVYWQKALEYIVMMLNSNQNFIAIYTSVSYLLVFSMTGRPILPELWIPELRLLKINDWLLMVLYQSGDLQCWDLQGPSQLLSTHIAYSSLGLSKQNITEFDFVNRNPYVEFSTGEGFLYDLELKAWVKVKVPNFLQRPEYKVNWNPAEIDSYFLSSQREVSENISIGEIEFQLIRTERMGYYEDYQYLLKRYIVMLRESRNELKILELKNYLEAQHPDIYKNFTNFLN